MNTTTLNVPDISCGHCKSSIEGAVNELAAGAVHLRDQSHHRCLPVGAGQQRDQLGGRRRHAHLLGVRDGHRHRAV